MPCDGVRWPKVASRVHLSAECRPLCLYGTPVHCLPEGETALPPADLSAKVSGLADGEAFPPAGTLPASASDSVQTQQPCSLKGSLSSDNIYAGFQSEGLGAHSGLGQGTRRALHLLSLAHTHVLHPPLTLGHVQTSHTPQHAANVR